MKSDIANFEKKIDDCQNEIDKIDKRHSRCKSILKSILEGYKQFCDEVAINGDCVFQWFDKAEVFELIYSGYLEDIEVDEAKLQAMKEVFYMAWNNE